MTNSITIAWAMPVDAATLGARMEAHAKSKATIHTFRLCVQHAPPGAPLGRLPPELVEIVAARIQQSLFKKRMKKWKKSVNCAAGDCYPSDHFSQKEILSMKSDLAFCCQTDDEGDDGYCECFEMHLLNNDIGDNEHMQTVKTFLPKVEDNSFIEKSDKFAKCRKVCELLKCGKHLTLNACVQIFAQDFGLEAYFTVHRIYHWVFPSNHCPCLSNSTIVAFGFEDFLRYSSGLLHVLHHYQPFDLPGSLARPQGSVSDSYAHSSAQKYALCVAHNRVSSNF